MPLVHTSVPALTWPWDAACCSCSTVNGPEDCPLTSTWKTGPPRAAAAGRPHAAPRALLAEGLAHLRAEGHAEAGLQARAGQAAALVAGRGEHRVGRPHLLQPRRRRRRSAT